MKISFYGGAGEVGRNCFLLEDGSDQLLLDCGIKLGEKEEHPLISAEELRALKHIAITHSHLDHIGFLPHAFAKGCRARVYANKPTREVMQLLFSDYLKIGKGKGVSAEHVSKAMKSVELVRYGERKHVGLSFSFHKAGHILGSAQALVKSKSGKQILYTGDVNNRETKLLDPAEKGLRAETLIMESTYGGREDLLPGVKKASGMLVESINQTMVEGGSVLIPSFAVGRAQEVMLILDDYMRSGLLERVPVYVEGMILKANKIYRENLDYARKEINRSIRHSDYDPFKSPSFKENKTRGMPKEQCIIVATSGMLTGGPALSYLKRMAGQPRNKMIFVGYQAPGTLGRKILDGEKDVMLKKERLHVEMNVEKISLSAHADHQGLLEIAHGVKGLKKIFVIHGEPEKTKQLAEDLSKDYEVIIPKLGETHEV